MAKHITLLLLSGFLLIRSLDDKEHFIYYFIGLALVLFCWGVLLFNDIREELRDD